MTSEPPLWVKLGAALLWIFMILLFLALILSLIPFLFAIFTWIGKILAYLFVEVYGPWFCWVVGEDYWCGG